jgi:hypothetical protein
MKKRLWFGLVICILVAICLVAGLAGFGLAQDKEKLKETKEKPLTLAQIAPAKTICYVAFNELSVNKEKIKETIAYRVMNFFAKKETLKAIKNIVEPKASEDDEEDELDELDIDKACRKAWGIGIKEISDLFNGEIAFALTGFSIVPMAEPEVYLLLKADINDPDKAMKIIGKIFEMGGEKLPPSYEMAETKATIFKLGPNEKTGVCFSIYKGSFLLSLSKKSLENTIKKMAGTILVKEDLASYPSYQKVNAKIKGDKADFILYLNCEDILHHPMLKMVPFNVESLLETLGLKNVKSFGTSMSVKEGRFYDYTYLYSPGDKKGILEAMAIPRVNDPEGILLTGENDIGLFGGVFAISMISAIAIPNLLSSKLAANETMALNCLMVLRGTEATWRQMDYDRNGKQDFWTYDISCLYRMKDKTGEAVQTIDIQFARADAAPAGDDTFKGEIISIGEKSPKAGYYFRAIEKDSEGKAYNENEVAKVKAANSFKWAFCAYPAQYGKTGRRTFIINEEGVVYSKDVNGEPVTQWPCADPTEEDWQLAR